MKATNNIRRFQLCVILSMAMSYGLPTVSQGGEICPTNSSGPDICVSFDGDTPELDFDFTVDYMTDPANPSVTLKTGSLTWNVRSRVGPPPNDTPANMGTISLDPTVSSDNFKVKIANGAGPGAVNVGTINLDDTGFTGSSSIAAISFISGDLGGLTLVNGGVLDGLVVTGNLTGPLTVPTVKQSGPIPSVISGNVIGAADITIGRIDGGGFTIHGSLVCTGAVCPDITVTDEILNGSLVVDEDVPSGSIIKIQELKETGTGTTLVKVSNNAEFAGTLDLPNGLANPNTLIDMGGEFSGVVDFHGGAVAGEYAGYVATTTAEIKNGGAVSGVVYLSQNITDKDYQYEGTATFASVTSTGEIGTQTIDPNGSAHFSGILNVTSGVAGLIEIAGSHLLGAEINIGSLSGDIEISENCVGSLSISGSCKGDVDIEGDLIGSVSVGGALESIGRILVAGESSGAIKVGEKTGSLTLIQVVGGLAVGLGTTNTTIEINTTRGNFNAHGDIHIGGPLVPLLPPLPFEGCIRIYDDGTGGGGALKGDIDIVGCHDPVEEELMICVDGLITGSVTLHQTGCGGVPATWGCLSPGCP